MLQIREKLLHCQRRLVLLAKKKKRKYLFQNQKTVFGAIALSYVLLHFKLYRETEKLEILSNK